MAVKAAHDMDLFKLLSQATSSMTVAELAAAKSADPLLVGEIDKNLSKILWFTSMF